MKIIKKIFTFIKDPFSKVKNRKLGEFLYCVYFVVVGFFIASWCLNFADVTFTELTLAWEAEQFERERQETIAGLEKDIAEIKEEIAKAEKEGVDREADKKTVAEVEKGIAKLKEAIAKEAAEKEAAKKGVAKKS